jgi:hypothetical protein
MVATVQMEVEMAATMYHHLQVHARGHHERLYDRDPTVGISFNEQTLAIYPLR